MMNDREPIVAVATGRETSAVAIIRVSGFNLLPQLSSCIASQVDRWQARKFYLTEIVDKKTVIDKVLGVFFRAPNSYTGQDVFEIHCHGGQYVRQKILDVLHERGIRSAEAGEFTRRAFLYGKLDLATAEGVAQLISAQTAAQWQAAQNLASGRLHGVISQLRAQLVRALSLLNATIDFPDEKETQSLHRPQVYESFQTSKEKIAQLIASYQQGKIAKDGLRLALIGAPNVGKSSLLNVLLDRDRAIVSTQAGTTRDYLEDSFLLAGRLFKVIDTAGIRETSDNVERQGVEKTLAIIAECDLILRLATAQDTLVRPEIDTDKKIIEVINKIDLCPSFHKKEDEAHVYISCKTVEGLPSLRKKLVAEFDKSTETSSVDDMFISCERHRYALQQAHTCVTNALEALDSGLSEECVAFEGQAAVNYVEEIIGKVSTDDLLDEIFAKFCLGK